MPASYSGAIRDSNENSKRINFVSPIANSLMRLGAKLHRDKVSHIPWSSFDIQHILESYHAP